MPKSLPHAVVLPSPLQRRLEAAASQFLQVGSTIDFTLPPGEPALVMPDSVSWRVFKNPLSLFIGGVTAVLLELAEPRVRTGVWNHTTFRQDPVSRLRRTGMAAMMTVYGPRTRTEAMISGISRMHGNICGTTPDGQAYRADDPELLRWVHATASFGFVEAYHAYVNPLSDEQRDAYYAEGRASASLYGAVGVPASQQELNALFLAMRDKLAPSPIVFEFLDIMQHVRLLPYSTAIVQRMLVKAAVELLPLWAMERLQLDASWRLAAWQRRLIRQCGGAADRILLRASPAVQACRRLGLPEDYLFK